MRVRLSAKKDTGPTGSAASFAGYRAGALISAFMTNGTRSQALYQGDHNNRGKGKGAD